MKGAAPWVIYTSLQDRFFCEPQSGERTGHWLHAPATATHYPTKADAERAMRRITSALTRHQTRVVTLGHAFRLANRSATPQPTQTTTENAA